MKVFRSVFLAVLLIGLPALVFAANTKTITITEPATVGSKVLQPGDYKISWDGSGPTVDVKFQQNGKTVVTAPATVKKEKTGYEAGAVDLKSENPNGSGAKMLESISFKDMALVFGDNASPEGQKPKIATDH